MRLLLGISARRVTWGVYRAGRLVDFDNHANDGAALAAFGAFLDAHRGVPLYVMLDVVEEEFRSEVLPHVFGRARREMVERKLSQYFRNAPYRAACRQGRLPDGRRDDQYLFMTVTSDELLRPYLEQVTARRAPLAGVYLMPLVSQQLVARSFPSGGVLMVSLQGGGLRQSLFVDGWLRISRQTPLESSVPDFAGLLATEMEKSRLFLYNSRLYARDALLEAWVLDPTGELAAACAQVPVEPHFRCHSLSGAALARAFDLRERALPQDSDALMLCLLGRQGAEGNLAARSQTAVFTERGVRRLLNATAAGIAACSLAVSGYELYRARLYEEQAAGARREAGLTQARYEEAKRRFPAAPARAEHLRQAVEAAKTLDAQLRLPDAALARLGQVLLTYPQVEIERLAWRRADLAASLPAARGQGEILELSGEIRPFDGDYRAALALIEGLVASLRAQPGVQEVRIARLPVNLDAKAPLAGNTAERADAAQAPFELVLILESRS
jgi:hypothetical protein